MSSGETDSNGQNVIMALMSGPGSKALLDSMIAAFVYFGFLTQLVAFTTVRARFASLKFASPEDKIVIEASRTYEPVGDSGQGLVEVKRKTADKPSSTETKSDDDNTKDIIDDKAEQIKPSTPKDVEAFVRVMEKCMLIVPNPFPKLIEQDVERWERIHRHLTENNVTFCMLVIALYFAVIRCQMLNTVDEFGFCPLCEEISYKGASTIYSYISSRALHFIVYSYAIRQPYRAIAYLTSQIHLCFILYLVWKAVH